MVLARLQNGVHKHRCAHTALLKAIQSSVGACVGGFLVLFASRVQFWKKHPFAWGGNWKGRRQALVFARSFASSFASPFYPLLAS